MPIELKPLKKPKLKNVEMLCDTVIDNKLLKYPVIEDCFSRTNFTILTGLMGQGKTTLATQMINSLYRGVFSDIYVVMPQSSIDSIPDKYNFTKHLDPDEHLYHEYNEDTLNTIYNKLHENAENDNHSLLLLDDFGNDYKDKRCEKLLNRIIIRMRHLRCSVVILAQNIYQLPKKMREVASNLVTYNLGKAQMEKIFHEFMNMKADQFVDVMRLYKEPHDYLLLNIRKQKLYYKFEAEVIITDGEKSDDSV
jgi:DNA replication protein DnaC